METQKLYKVLVDGRSCHGGSLVWSLPTDKPGEWHEVPGTLEKCSWGLHLTTEPARWWKHGAAVFEVEAEGVEGEPDEDAKVVAQRVRLMRAVTGEEELRGLRIFTSGVHEVRGEGAWVAGSATVTASGSATVTAYGSATVTAYGSATVTAYGSATVTAYDSATVTAYGSATVTAERRALVSVRCGSPKIALKEYAVCVDYRPCDAGKAPVVTTAETAK